MPRPSAATAPDFPTMDQTAGDPGLQRIRDALLAADLEEDDRARALEMIDREARASKAAARAERDRALASYAAEALPGMKPTPAAMATLTALHRYVTAGWPRDRNRVGLPDRLANHPDRHLWAAVACGAPMPTTARTIYTALTGR